MYVVIVKTGKDHKKWKGIHDDYPVHCEEFPTLEEALAAYPDKTPMLFEEYREHAQFFHTNHPKPVSKPWWRYLLFWRRE